METIRNVNLNGKRIFPFNSANELLDFIQYKKIILVAVGTEKILNEDPKLTKIINTNVGYPDGIGTVMALSRKGFKAAKIRGAELWLEIVKKYYLQKSFYLLGAKYTVIDNTVKKLNEEYPGIKILKFRDGYFSDGELSIIKNEIVTLKPDIVFVALGSPKQEYLMDDFMKFHPALYMGLGGSFDLYSGKAKGVPDWWNRIVKWEGLYRVLNDFKNIKRWKRQLVGLLMLYKLLLNRL